MTFVNVIRLSNKSKIDLCCDRKGVRIDPQWSPMISNNPQWSQMIPQESKSSKIPDDPQWSEWSKKSQRNEIENDHNKVIT